MEVEDESGALGELGIDVEVTVHLQGHLLADGESEAVASGEVANLKEWLEDVFTLQFYVFPVRNEKKKDLSVLFHLNSVSLWRFYNTVARNSMNKVAIK